MEWSRVKTILICFLLAINVILAAFLGLRIYERNSLERQIAADTAAAVARYGISLDEGLIRAHEEQIYPMECERDEALEAEMFGRLVEPDGGSAGAEIEPLGAGIYSISGSGGSAQIRNMGAFEASFTGRRLIIPEGENAAHYLLSHMGIAEPEDRTESGGNVTDGNVTLCTQVAGGYPVFNMEYRIETDGDAVISMSGNRLTGGLYYSSDAVSKSAATVLLAFASRVGGGATSVSEITDIELGYYAGTASPGYTELNPCWKISTDSGIWLVDAYSFEILQSQ